MDTRDHEVMMGSIQTAPGTCEPKDLGFTLIHEHILVGMPGWELDGTKFERKQEIRKTVDKLKEVKDLGVTSFVDPCPMDLGRDAEFTAEVSSKSGLRVVVATGLYNDLLGIPTHFRSMGSDDLAALYVNEITEGIGETGVRAGIIKTATGGVPGMTETAPEITRMEEICLRAAARAHGATGVPILCHNDEQRPFGLETLDIFEEEGVDPSRVLIGHACGVADMRYYFKVLERGAWLGFDRFGIETICSDKMRMASLIGLLAVGFDRIMLSHDAVSCWLGRVTDQWRAFIDASPNWKYTHILKNILPALAKAGVSEDKVRTMTMENPRSYFDA